MAMSTETNKTHWDCMTNQRIVSPRIDSFLKEIEEVCKKHNLSISHEDGHGNFIVEAYDIENIKWLNDCYINFT